MKLLPGANEVIDYYLNGPGSYFESGTQKPLVSELEHSAVADLKNFRNSVIASMQFADDPNLIMRSIAELIDQRIRQIEEAAQNSRGREIVPPDTNDPIDDHRIISPRALSNEALRISLPVEAGQQSSSMPEVFNSKPMRYLGRRIAGQPEPAVFDTGAPPVPLVPSDEVFPPSRPGFLADRFGNRDSAAGSVSPNGGQPMLSPNTNRPLGLVSGQPMLEYRLPSSIWGLPDGSEARDEDSGDWLMRLLRSASSR